jgi:hypothetical protein
MERNSSANVRKATIPTKKNNKMLGQKVLEQNINVRRTTIVAPCKKSNTIT